MNWSSIAMACLVKRSIFCGRCQKLSWLITTFIITAKTVSQCIFPKDWRGTWYENRLGDITIGLTNITQKGVCEESNQNYYLLENRDLSCHQCLCIEQRHTNVLQYRESFCVSENTLEFVCSQINMETLQNTLVREPSQPVPCPFSEAFHFQYNNNSGGLCSNPSSYVKPCASVTQLRLHFRRCPDAAYSYERDIDLECLATWKGGPHEYIFGRQRGKDVTDKNSLYRCFMYRVLGTIVYLSASADASCRGLRSPKDGPLVMEFTQDVFGWPRTQCTYPAWITRNSWRDLSGRHLYRPNDMGDVIELSFRQTISSNPEVDKSFRCYRVLPQNTTQHVAVAVTFLLYGCKAKYQCIKFVKRRDGVLEIHEGLYMDYADEHCRVEDMLDSNKRLLIADVVHGRACPFQGQHLILLRDSSKCPTYFRSGCTRSTITDVHAVCETHLDFQLECLKTWKEKRKLYLVARMSSSSGTKLSTVHGTSKLQGEANCFSFRRLGDMLEFAFEPTCDVGSASHVTDHVMYVMALRSAACDAQSRSLAPIDVSGGSASAVGQSIDGSSVEDYEDAEGPADQHHHFGGPYRHVYVDDSGQADDPNFSNESTTNSSPRRLRLEALLWNIKIVLLVLSSMQDAGIILRCR